MCRSEVFHNCTREDLNESIDFALRNKVKAAVHTASQENINKIFNAFKAGHVQGRLVLDIAGTNSASPPRELIGPFAR
jgi:D-arabinose 1-dehydrogenase-like Zn-dependent alcohol dehydrogenase